MNQKPTFAHEPNLCTCLDCVALAGEARAAHDAAEGPAVIRAGTKACPAQVVHAEHGLLRCEGSYGHAGHVHGAWLPGGPPGESEMFHWPHKWDIAGEPLGLEDDARFAHVRMVHLQLTGERDRLKDMLAALEVACADYDREGRELAADLGQVWP